MKWGSAQGVFQHAVLHGFYYDLQTLSFNRESKYQDQEMPSLEHQQL